MAVSNPQKLSVEKYLAEKVDRVVFDVPKGMRDGMNAAARSLNLSTAQLIRYSVAEYVTNHAGEDVAASVELLAASTNLPSEDVEFFVALKKLPKDTRRAVFQLVEHLAEKFESGSAEG